MRQRDQMPGIGNVLQHIVEMDDIECAQRRRACGVEETFGDQCAQSARMRCGLT
jgi:hypothetical protein